MAYCYTFYLLSCKESGNTKLNISNKTQIVQFRHVNICFSTTGPQETLPVLRVVEILPIDRLCVNPTQITLKAQTLYINTRWDDET